MSSAKKALREVLATLDGWIEGAQINHEALGHRDTDCCTTFHAEDIRNMVADAGRTIEAKKRRKRVSAARAVQIQLVVGQPEGEFTVPRSFLIMSGDTVSSTLTAYVEGPGPGEVRRITLPVNIQARIA